MGKPYVKCVLVGDDTVGKSSLLISFATKKFPFKPVDRPAIFDGYCPSFTIDGTTTVLALFDTAGNEYYDRLRPLAYPQTDVFLICFSLVDPNSYEQVRTKWAPELAFHGPTAPIIVVGTKSDLREDQNTVDTLRNRNTAPIQYHQGLAMSKDVGADFYLECSALTTLGVQAVFEQAVRFGLWPPRKRSMRKEADKRKCIIV